MMHASVERRVREKLSRLINLYLIHYIEDVPPLKIDRRVGLGYDWDLLGLISEIRSILYGGLSENQLFQFVRHGKKLRSNAGIYGFLRPAR
jgi:RNA-directed DNA polymerase